jgi:hypothetical protein
MLKRQGPVEVDVHRAITSAGSSPEFQHPHHCDPKRLEMWANIINNTDTTRCAEIGVYRGNFAQHILHRCNNISQYYMIDPWQHLDNWNKPANVPNDEFRAIKREALAVTEFAGGKRVVLEGTTTEVSGAVPDQGLDFAYIDGDHSLRGITIDLIRIWPKVRDGGILGGDDFLPSVWQHDARYEPTLVCPLAVYFAEAMGAAIYSLPNSQFAIVVDRSAAASFAFHDLTGLHKDLTLRTAMAQMSKKKRDALHKRALRRIKRLIARP